jgi:hypothetical protein
MGKDKVKLGSISRRIATALQAILFEAYHSRNIQSRYFLLAMADIRSGATGRLDATYGGPS